MELTIGNTKLRYNNNQLERFWILENKWKIVKLTPQPNGYCQIKINNQHYGLHRIIYKIFNPDWDINDNLQIDHINRNRNDNRIENLRLVSHSQNQRNKTAKGYLFDKQKNKWRGHIRIGDDGKLIYKLCDSEEEARLWYLEQKAIHHII